MKIKLNTFKNLFPLEFYDGEPIKLNDLDCLIKPFGGYVDEVCVKKLLKEIATKKYGEGYSAGQRKVKDDFKSLMT
jgi:hypothetical protein